MSYDSSSIRFPLDEYRSRIGVSAVEGATVDRLHELQQAQLLSIPYENFDIALGRGVQLSPDRLIQKLLRSPRGGYCFELNGLFHLALQAEGFEVRPLLGRVHLFGEPTGREHQLALVRISGRDWIADVGGGKNCPSMPILLEDGAKASDNRRSYRLIAHELGYMVQFSDEGNWVDFYSFDLMPVVPNDIAQGNHFTSTHPSSFFTSARVAMLHHSDGITTLLNFRCTVDRGGKTATEILADDQTYLEKLKRITGIDLDADYQDLAPVE
jgi:N-hydroxyarylamine O-acetyltransferase